MVKAPVTPSPAASRGAGSSEAPLPASPESREASCEAVMFADNKAGTRGLSSFEDTSGLVGFRDATDRVVIKPTFRFAYEFSEEGITGAVDAKGTAVFLDTTGRVLAEALLFDNGPDYFQAGFARIARGGKIGFLDAHGRVAIEPRWDGAYSFCGGLAPVCLGCARGTADEHDTWLGGRWGYVDTHGTLVVPLEYEEASMFHDGEAQVVQSGKWLRIDKEGHILGPVIEDAKGSGK